LDIHACQWLNELLYVQWVHDQVYGISKVALSIYLKQIKDFGSEKVLIETSKAEKKCGP
jgi:hypothetical protein